MIREPGVAKNCLYSRSGKYLAVVHPLKGVQIRNIAEDMTKAWKFLELPDIVEIAFSPKETYICTFVKQQKTEDGSHQNVSIYKLSDLTIVWQYAQKMPNNW